MTFVAVPGTRIGDYVIVSEIGRGGMAVVYLAEHPALGRKVALKLVADRLSDDQVFRDRFMREIHVAAGIEHPNIVPVYDAGEFEGLLFMAMRYVEGIDLEKLLEWEQDVPLPRTQQIVSQVAAALDAAHAKGLVHRDVKPSNVLLAAGQARGGDHAYLTDFGIARPQIGSDLTLAGELQGTLDYMAPEQFDGRPIDARTDVYALACVAYECLTGEPPFREESLLAKAAAHLSKYPILPSERNPDLPKQVDEAILRGLEKEKSRRHEHAGFFAEALAEALYRDRRQNTDSTTRRRSLLEVPAPIEVPGAIHIPAQPTPFVGREPETSAVIELLNQEDIRLLTLTGPGGSGKTRLAIEAATLLSKQYPEGTWFVPLASIADPTLVASTLALALGLPMGMGQAPEEVLQRHLATRRVLIILDNVEQLLPGVATLFADLIANSADHKLIVSSREALAIRAEHVYPVRELAMGDAVALFIERAKAVRPEFQLDHETGPVVEAICSRLDDLPLAIELAAARLQVLSPRELLDGLETRLPLLVAGPLDAPERQRTMRAAIAWSYDLLSDDERALFARLAVFSGGCSLRAAREVCGAGLETLGALAHRNQLRVEDGPGGESRYTTLETVREFALELLGDRSEARVVQRRHAEYFLRMASDSFLGLRERGQDVWLQRLEMEHDNIRAALRWSLAQGEPEIALAIASTIWRFWMLHGDMIEGFSLLMEALRSTQEVASETLCRALLGAGWLAASLGDGRGVGLLEDALRISDEASPAVRALVLTNLGGALSRADPARARKLSELAVTLARQAEDRSVLAGTLNNRAELFREDGNDSAAAALYEEAYRIGLAIGDEYSVTGYLLNLGEMAHLRGSSQESHELITQALELAERRNDRFHVPLAELDLGWVSLAEARPMEAEQHFRRSVLLLRALGYLPASVSALRGLAATEALQGRDEEAGRLIGVADAIEEGVGGLPTPPDGGVHEPHLNGARARIGEDAWDRFRAEGRLMEVDAALSWAANGAH